MITMAIHIPRDISGCRIVKNLKNWLIVTQNRFGRENFDDRLSMNFIEGNQSKTEKLADKILVNSNTQYVRIPDHRDKLYSWKFLRNVIFAVFADD